MAIKQSGQSTFNATTSEVLPTMGLAYLVDENSRTWAVTRQDTGVGFDSLKPGKAVRITVAHYPKFSLVDRCEALN
ncbi:hypothetical protein [Aquabacterium sp.]|uniref:hypothetical protein n=1 Tax=Aquabacterium sp. TaxID=1872578 RepID=UPI0040378D2C